MVGSDFVWGGHLAPSVPWVWAWLQVVPTVFCTKDESFSQDLCLQINVRKAGTEGRAGGTPRAIAGHCL